LRKRFNASQTDEETREKTNLKQSRNTRGSETREEVIKRKNNTNMYID
jgi:hypothetical protein